MLKLVNTAARFLLNQEFRLPFDGKTSALRAAGCHRVGRGQLFQIFCSVLIPVVLCPALTKPVAFAEAKRVVDKTTGRTSFARSEPAVCSNDRCTGKLSFVVELPSDFGHRGVHYGLSETAIRYHSSDVQVFNADPTETSDQLRSQFVRHVLTYVGASFVQPLELCSRLLPVLPSFVSTRQLFVQHPLTLFYLTQRSRCFDTFSGRKNGKVYDAQIYSDSCLGFTAVGIRPAGFVDLDLYRYIPVPCVLREACRKDVARKAQRLPGSNPSNLWHFDSECVKLYCSSLNAKSRFCPLFTFETRVTGLFSDFYAPKKVLKSVVQILQSAIGYRPGKFFEPKQVASFARINFAINALPVGLAARFIYLLPAIQTEIVNKTRRTSKPFQLRHLHVVRVEPNPLSQNHLAFIAFRTIRRRISDIDTSLRLASSRSHAKSGGSKDSLILGIRCSFFGAGMVESIATPNDYVKRQLDGCLVNKGYTVENTSELKFRRKG